MKFHTHAKVRCKCHTWHQHTAIVCTLAMKRAKHPRVSNGVLHRLYSEPLCLQEAISELAPCETSLTERVVQPGDAQVVWQRFEDFLQRTIVCFRSQLPSLQQPWRLSQRFTQEQVKTHKAQRTAVQQFQLPAVVPSLLISHPSAIR